MAFLRCVGGWARAVLGAVALLGGAGCVKIDQTLTLEKDGSGLMEIRYETSEAMAEEVQAGLQGLLGAEDGDATLVSMDISEAQMREAFQEYESFGVTLESFMSETRDGARIWQLRARFKDMAGLAATPLIAHRRLTLSKDTEGRYVFTQQPFPEDREPSSNGAVPDPVTQEMLRGFKAVMRVVVPGPIVETGAPRHTECAAEWEFDYDTDPRALDRMEATVMRVVFDGEGLNIPSFDAIAGDTWERNTDGAN